MGGIMPTRSGAGVFADLSGVDIADANDGALLVYDETAGVWTYGVAIYHLETTMSGSGTFFVSPDLGGFSLGIQGITIDSGPPLTKVFGEIQDAGEGAIFGVSAIQIETGGTESLSPYVGVEAATSAGGVVSDVKVRLEAPGPDGIIQTIGGMVLDGSRWGTPSATDTPAAPEGAISFDADYLYICVAENTWKRVALSAIP